MININTIKELYDKNTPSMQTGQLVLEALELFDSSRSSAIVIIDDKKHPRGILTERDITKHAGHWDEIIVLPVAEVMSSPVATVGQGHDFRDAYMQMSENGFRHLVVTKEDGSFAGMLDEGHFLRHLTPEQLLAVKEVKLVMSKKVTTVETTQSVAETIKLMSEAKISSVIIVSDKKPLGIFTERDSIGLARHGDALLEAPISEYMTSPLKTIREERSVIDAEHMLTHEHIRHLIVVNDKEELSGIVSQHDLVKGISGIYVEMLRDTIRKQSDQLYVTYNQLEELSVLNNILDSFSDRLIIACDVNSLIKFTNADIYQCLFTIPQIGNKIDESVEFFDNSISDSILKSEVPSVVNLEPIIYDEKGEKHYFKTSYAPIFSQKKLLQGFLFTAEDITSEKQSHIEREETTEKLKESEKQFKAIFDNTLDGILVADTKTQKFSLGNQAICNMLGYTLDELKNLSVFDIHPEESLPYVLEKFEKLSKGEETVARDLPVLRKDASVFYADITAQVVMLDNQAMLLGIFHDITETKEAKKLLEEQNLLLLEQKEQLLQAQKLGKIGSWKLDIVKNKLDWSDEIFNIFEMDKRKFKASYEAFLDAIHPEDRDAVNQAYTQSLQNRLPYSITHRLLLQDGTIKWVVENCTTTFDKDGNPLESLGTVQDITQEKQTKILLEEQNLLLEEREQQLLQAQAIAKIGNWSLDIETMQSYWSDEIIEMIGIEADIDVSIEFLEKIVVPEDWPNLESSLMEVLKDGTPYNIDYRMQRQSDNEIRWINCRAIRISDNNKKPVKIVGTVQDITEKKEKELIIIQQEELFRAIFEQASVGVAQIDSKTGQFIKVNQTYADIVGRSVEEMLTIDFMQITHPDELEEDLKNMQALKEASIPHYMMRKRYYRPDGDLVWVNLHVSPLHRKDGELESHIAIVVDITKQISFEEQLKDAKKQFQRFYYKTPVMMHAIGKDFKLKEVSDRWLETLGYTREEVIGHDITEFETVETTKRVKEVYLPELMRTGELRNGELQFYKKSGEIAYLELNAIPELDEKGEFLHGLGFLIDVTELREKDKILLLQSRQAAMGEMINMIAHQWRQPLSVISMIVNGILLDIEIDTIDTNTTKKDLLDINDHIQYMSKTIDDFRNFFKHSKEVEKDSALNILQDVIKIISPSLNSNSIQIEIECDPKLMLQTYKSELKQVIINILSNAKDALKERQVDNKIIKISVKAENEYIVFSIFNNGPKIDSELLQRIFEPYFTTKEILGGTGIGLYMSKSIIEKHLHGNIEAKNTNKGVEFIITIPEILEGTIDD